MLGLPFYVILSCTIQLTIANPESNNGTQSSPLSPPAGMLNSTIVQSSPTASQASFPPTHSKALPGPQHTPVQSHSLFCQSFSNFFGKGCHPVLLLVGGLMIACTVLVLSTLVLAWKVCLLSKRVSALSSNADLISQTERTRRATVKKSSLSEAELREDSMLMADHLHDGKGGTEEKEEEEEEEEGTAREDKPEEAVEAAKTEEASPAPAENSSSPAPQEEPAKAASTSEGTEKPKAEV